MHKYNNFGCQHIWDFKKNYSSAIHYFPIWKSQPDKTKRPFSFKKMYAKRQTIYTGNCIFIYWNILSSKSSKDLCCIENGSQRIFLVYNASIFNDIFSFFKHFINILELGTFYVSKKIKTVTDGFRLCNRAVMKNVFARG